VISEATLISDKVGDEMSLDMGHSRPKRMVLNLRRLRAADQHTAASSGYSLRGLEECGLVSSLIKSR